MSLSSSLIIPPVRIDVKIYHAMMQAMVNPRFLRQAVIVFDSAEDTDSHPPVDLLISH